MLVTACVSAQAAAVQEVRIGVLSFRPLEQTRQQWQPTADYLSRAIPGYHFSVEPLFYREMDLAVNRHEFDFVLTNPEHYITTRADHGLSAIATLMPLAEGHPVTQFGGVIFTRADRDDINDLPDLKGKRVVSPFVQSLGGYLMQRWELYKKGVPITELKEVRFTGMPHDKVVHEVLAGMADAGFVRTGILEGMAREGALKLEQVKVLNRQLAESFPQQLSTALYPEWPLAAMPDVPDALLKRVMLALLSIEPGDEAARRGNYYGFSPPGNYAAIEAVMTRLKVNPERAHEFDLRDVTRKYALELMAGSLALVLSLLAGGAYLARNNAALRQSRSKQQHLQEQLEWANATLEDKVARRTAELQESEARFRFMFERHSSPMLLIEPDSGRIVDANAAAADFYGYHTGRLREMNIADINTQSPQQVAAERQQALREERNYFVFPHRLASGEVRTVEVYSSPVISSGRTLLFSIVHDVTERTLLEQQMRDMAFYDQLTRLPNRRLLLDRLSKALESCARSHRHGALMFLDLDNFKTLNDLHGHDAGDAMLVEAARRISACIREEDSAARFGGDEFVVMLEGLSEHTGEALIQAERVAEKLRTALAQPYLLPIDHGGQPIVHHCSSSIGVTLFREHNESLEQLLRWTDMAMYRAKESGRNAIRFFDPAMQQAIETRAALEADLRDALARGQFQLHYQVQVNAAGWPQGAEVLLRWVHPQRGMVSPAQFIPLAEETGLILPIGAWVLDQACAQLRRWRDEPAFRNLSLAVNVSARQFRQADFVDQVRAVVERHGIAHTSLKLELTESMVLHNVEDTIVKMRALKEYGVRFSMDDFGTGYSSLSYLKRLPLDQLKIDQSFVHDLVADQGDKVMVMTLVDLGMNFELDVIAEGVETDEQFKLLHRYGCGHFQGYLFGKPLPLQAFETDIRKKMPG